MKTCRVNLSQVGLDPFSSGGFGRPVGASRISRRAVVAAAMDATTEHCRSPPGSSLEGTQ